jgi:hypothetical protein
VRLVPGFDAVVLGTGTDDTTVGRRTTTTVSRQAGWISPSSSPVAGGQDMGAGRRHPISWFAEAGRTPNTALDAEVERLSGILGNVLRTEVAVA